MHLENILFAMSLTLLIEPFLLWIVSKRNNKIFFTTFTMNSITNPTMNILLYLVSPNEYYVYLFIFEICTVILETLIIFIINKTDLVKTLLYVFLANLVSFIFGMMFNMFNMNLLTMWILIGVFILLEGGLFIFVILRIIFIHVSNREEDNHKNDTSN